MRGWEVFGRIVGLFLAGIVGYVVFRVGGEAFQIKSHDSWMLIGMMFQAAVLAPLVSWLLIRWMWPD